MTPIKINNSMLMIAKWMKSQRIQKNDYKNNQQKLKRMPINTE
jgi:hypothetical protein